MPRKTRWFRFHVRGLLAATTSVCVALGVWRGWEYVPGTYYVDKDGHSHGTGKEIYYYNSGEIRLVEFYRAGVLREQTYYGPDGEIVASSMFDKERGGICYALRQDGTIRAEYPCQFFFDKSEFFAHGTAKHYHVDGSVERVVEYSKGRVVPQIQESNSD